MNKKLEIVELYFEYFYNTFDPSKLQSIFSKNLKFSGPFYSFNSADDYIQSLILDPPGDMSYKPANVFISGDTVCSIYRFKKGQTECDMCQLFMFDSENKICEIKLIFDSNRFKH